MKQSRTVRRVQRTVLLVGEGASEVLFIGHLKRLYHQRESGVSVTIKNARGKGAGHVIDFAIGQSRNAAYDIKLALLDTDADWTDKVRKTARSNRVHVLPCEPCLESMLLVIHKKSVAGRTTAQLKTLFTAEFGVVASDDVMLKHFPKIRLNEARSRVSILNKLLEVIEQGAISG